MPKMKNRFLEKAVARIQPEERALMIKSLEIISRIHDILKRKKITQKELATKLGVSPAAISKMLSPGGNLELGTLIRLELILGGNNSYYTQTSYGHQYCGNRSLLVQKYWWKNRLY